MYSLAEYKLPYYRVVLLSSFNSGHTGRNHNLFMKWSKEDSSAGFTEDFLLLISAL